MGGGLRFRVSGLGSRPPARLAGRRPLPAPPARCPPLARSTPARPPTRSPVVVVIVVASSSSSSSSFSSSSCRRRRRRRLSSFVVVVVVVVVRCRRPLSSSVVDRRPSAVAGYQLSVVRRSFVVDCRCRCRPLSLACMVVVCRRLSSPVVVCRRLSSPSSVGRSVVVVVGRSVGWTFGRSVGSRSVRWSCARHAAPVHGLASRRSFLVDGSSLLNH